MTVPQNTHTADVLGRRVSFCLRLGQLADVQRELAIDDVTRLPGMIVAAVSDAAEMKRLAAVVLDRGLDGAGEDRGLAMQILDDLPFLDLHQLTVEIAAAAFAGRPSPAGPVGKLASLRRSILEWFTHLRRMWASAGRKR